MGVFRSKFAGKFTDGEVIREDGENGRYFYQSKNLNVTVTTNTYTYEFVGDTYDCIYYLTDIYVADIACFQTRLARDTYGTGIGEWLYSIAKRTGCVVAVNGDFYSTHSGIMIRNGELYRSNLSRFDACVINWDGTMVTYPANTWDVETLTANGAYQAWCFGPQLLD